MTAAKTCIDCHTTKPTADYQRDSSTNDGHARRCRPCTATYQLQLRTRRPPLPAPPADETWKDNAACKDMPTRVFFPEAGGSYTDAVKVCSGCPVRLPCLAYALDENIGHGVFGGVSERGRKQMRRGRRRVS